MNNKFINEYCAKNMWYDFSDVAKTTVAYKNIAFGEMLVLTRFDEIYAMSPLGPTLRLVVRDGEFIDERKEFAYRFEAAIHRNAYTQTRLARDLGVSQPTVRNYIYGLTPIPSDILCRFARITGCSLDDILTDYTNDYISLDDDEVWDTERKRWLMRCR